MICNTFYFVEAVHASQTVCWFFVCLKKHNFQIDKERSYLVIGTTSLSKYNQKLLERGRHFLIFILLIRSKHKLVLFFSQIIEDVLLFSRHDIISIYFVHIFQWSCGVNFTRYVHNNKGSCTQIPRTHSQKRTLLYGSHLNLLRPKLKRNDTSNDGKYSSTLK